MRDIEKINQAREIAVQMVDTLQDIAENDMELAINSACISFAALAVAQEMSLHKAITLLMLIYKNTELVKD
jgi:phosphoserine phosphatase